MSADDISIVVTDRFTGWAKGFKRMGLKWAYRVATGEDSVIGAALTETAAWREARIIEQRLIKLRDGMAIRAYRDFSINEF